MSNTLVFLGEKCYSKDVDTGELYPVTHRCTNPKNPKRLQELSCNPDICPWTTEELIDLMLCGCRYKREAKKVKQIAKMPQ